MTLTHLAEKENNLPADANVTDILALTDEIQAYAVSTGDSEVITSLLVKLAQRIHPATATLPEAHNILHLARAGHHARHLSQLREQAYHDTYRLIEQLVSQGLSQVDAARISGFDRMTVRKAIGKPRKQKTNHATPMRNEHQEVEFDLILADSPREEPRYGDFPPHQDEEKLAHHEVQDSDAT